MQKVQELFWKIIVKPFKIFAIILLKNTCKNPKNPYNPPPNIRIFIMTTTRITRPRRLFVDALSQKDKTTFSELKDILVGK